jgi:membrane peptidoglycan carboxypeptidase
MGSPAAVRTEQVRGLPRPPAVRAAVWAAVALLAALTVAAELRGSWLQSSLGAFVARQLAYRVERGPSPAIRFPATGPYDERLGYTRIPERVERLLERGFALTAQARLSGTLLRLADLGLHTVYAEKDHAGLRLEDPAGAPLLELQHPRRVFDRFADVPPLVVQTLLFIENRELLEPGAPRRNPAVEWDRLAKALSLRLVGAREAGGRTGGSTLATQIEKYRHSHEGRTLSPLDKLRQIASASLRAYLGGPETLAARHAIVLSYLNSVPLAAASGFGEVSGLGDGLFAWYGAELDEVARLLRGPAVDGELAARARAFKQVLSLFIAERRPSYYLIEDPDALRRLTDVYLSLLHDAGVIDGFLYDAALTVGLERPPAPAPEPRPPFVLTKATDAVRTELLDLLGVPGLYDLDRLDLSVRTTLSAPAQAAVVERLRALADPAVAREAGLLAPRLLERGDPAGVVYSLLVYEETEQGFALRVLADTLDRPFNVNEGMKLDLGSTAKLRTLIHYLELVADLHAEYGGRPREELRRIQAHPADRIRGFVLERLRAEPTLPLSELLEAALERRYSASPAEAFATGGGLHRFRNYDRRWDGRVPTVREAFAHSVNLPFVRLMRDVVNHHIFGPSGFAERLQSDPAHPWRGEYLRRFAESEGRTYLDRFWAKHRALDPERRLATLAGQARGSALRLAALFRSLRPEADPAALGAFLARQLPGRAPEPGRVARLFAEVDPARLPLADRAYLARVHPLELWLVAFLDARPEASLAHMHAASADVRVEAYQWLFRKGRSAVQSRRIRSVLEREVFEEIHRAWARLGYPFPSLVPSLATAIGSSADRPAALAELMGILQAGGRRLPLVRVESLRFAEGTPYETRLERGRAAGETVLRPEVVEAVRGALGEVVEGGTARRLHGAFAAPGGEAPFVGGKTGTGDNRHRSFAPGGRLVDERVVSRTASFAFLLGERHFGVLTAYVEGEQAEDYVFTSALPLQALRTLEPALAPLFAEPPSRGPLRAS